MVIECFARSRGGVSVARAMAQRSAGAAMANSADAEHTAVCDSVALAPAPPRERRQLGIEVLEMKFMGSGRCLRRI